MENKNMTETEIVEQLIAAKDAYYNGEPFMTDSDFDFLENKLKLINPKNKYFNMVGISSPHSKKISHYYRMRSLQKANDENDFRLWYQRNKIPFNTNLAVMHKIDGLSGSAKYENGKIVYLATRGNSLEGQDVSHLIPYINIPQEISEQGAVYIRGEFVIKKNSYLSNLYPDSPLRNLASGIINRKEMLSEAKYLSFITYGLEGQSYETGLETEKIKKLKEFGFDTLKPFLCEDYAQLKQFLSDAINWREDVEYEIDGIVIVINDISIQRSLEDDNEHHPQWNIAWKFPSQGSWTTLKSIEWNTSKHGRLIPVGIFEPVIIGGAQITRATLNNYKQILDLKLNIGDSIFVQRANDVIPKITECKKIVPYEPILDVRCGCGTFSDLSLDGVHIYCKNPKCREKIIEQILFWVQKIGIEFFSRSTITTLYDLGKLNSIEDLYRLDYSTLSGIHGLGDKKIYNIINEVKRTSSMSQLDFLSSLGIPMVGKRVFQKLGIFTIQDFLNWKSFAYVTGEKIIEWKSDSFNIELFNSLVKCINFTEEEKMNSANKIGVCATGKGPFTRNDLVKKINESKDYFWVDSINNSVKILLCDDPSDNSSKLQKARKSGIKLVKYSDFTF
jgi:DNA ligase (NAD+)